MPPLHAVSKVHFGAAGLAGVVLVFLVCACFHYLIGSSQPAKDIDAAASLPQLLNIAGASSDVPPLDAVSKEHCGAADVGTTLVRLFAVCTNFLDLVCAPQPAKALSNFSLFPALVSMLVKLGFTIQRRTKRSKVI